MFHVEDGDVEIIMAAQLDAVLTAGGLSHPVALTLQPAGTTIAEVFIVAIESVDKQRIEWVGPHA